MPKSGKQLTAAFVKTVTEPGKYYDQNGLMLCVRPSGTKQWVQRLVVHGKRRDLSLRTYPLVTLAEARETAFSYRKLARAGGDPRALRRRPDLPTFEQAATKVIAIHRPSWKEGGKSAAQWRSSLEAYAFPHIGDMRIDQVTTTHILRLLLEIWHTRPETARRVLQRISTIMKWAVAQRYRPDDPAGEAVRAALPRHDRRPTHHRALPYTEVAAALDAVWQSDAYLATKLAVEFLALTACRSGEVRGARWAEIDFETETWTVPASRMKSRRPHRVPLSKRALEILLEGRKLSDDVEDAQTDGLGLIFPSPTARVLSDSSFSKLFRDLRIDATPHGLRSSFRDWAQENTDAPRAVMEAALAHVVGGVEGAYARSDLFALRRRLMDRWAAYLNQERHHGA